MLTLVFWALPTRHAFGLGAAQALGGLAHDVLKHFLDSTKGQFEAGGHVMFLCTIALGAVQPPCQVDPGPCILRQAVVAFSPTGWSWSKGMAQGSGVGMGAADQAAEQVGKVPGCVRIGNHFGSPFSGSCSSIYSLELLGWVGCKWC